jgi:purine-binding chemotaxis protein CheW
MAELENRLTVEQEDTQSGKFLTFELGSEAYGIEIRFVTEIVGIQPVTQVPEVPGYVKGIINLRGQVIPVIDMRLRFGKEEVGYTDRTCIIVIEIRNIPVGLIVDGVSEVIRISEDQIVPAPSYQSGMQDRFIKSIGKVGSDVKLLLDCDKIVLDQGMEEIG